MRLNLQRICCNQASLAQVWTDDAVLKLRILCSPPSLEAGAAMLKRLLLACFLFF